MKKLPRKRSNQTLYDSLEDAVPYKWLSQEESLLRILTETRNIRILLQNLITKQTEQLREISAKLSDPDPDVVYVLTKKKLDGAK